MAELRAIITGASRGLGQAIAREFWRQGAALALVARDAAALQALAEELRRTGGQDLHVVPADLSEPNAAAEIVERVRSQWDGLDALVNNAAIPGPIGRLWDNDWALWQRTMQVNLLSPVALCRLCVPWMRRGGAIVNLSGGGATSPRANFSAYGTAKAALVRFTETLAMEAAGLGIRANAISPGILNTAMVDAVIGAGPEHAGEDYARVLEVKRKGGEPPEKAAALAWHLASPAGAGITGRLISAVWDPWSKLSEHVAELGGSDIYTLRRITPEDRGMKWT